jgi:hypothetical protein
MMLQEQKSIPKFKFQLFILKRKQRLMGIVSVSEFRNIIFPKFKVDSLTCIKEWSTSLPFGLPVPHTEDLPELGHVTR